MNNNNDNIDGNLNKNNKLTQLPRQLSSDLLDTNTNTNTDIGSVSSKRTFKLSLKNKKKTTSKKKQSKNDVNVDNVSSKNNNNLKLEMDDQHEQPNPPKKQTKVDENIPVAKNNIKPTLDLDVANKTFNITPETYIELKSIVNEEIKPHMLSIIDNKNEDSKNNQRDVQISDHKNNKDADNVDQINHNKLDRKFGNKSNKHDIYNNSEISAISGNNSRNNTINVDDSKHNFLRKNSFDVNSNTSSISFNPSRLHSPPGTPILSNRKHIDRSPHKKNNSNKHTKNKQDEPLSVSELRSKLNNIKNNHNSFLNEKRPLHDRFDSSPTSSPLKDPPSFNDKMFMKEKSSLRDVQLAELNQDDSIPPDVESNFIKLPSYVDTNHQPIKKNIEKTVSPKTMTQAELQMTKIKELIKLTRLVKRGYESNRLYTITDKLEDIQNERQRLEELSNLDAGVKFQKNSTLMLASFIEMVNNYYNPFELQLNGWSDTLHDNMDSFEPIFEELYEKYKEQVQLAPEIKLLLLFFGSAISYHLTNIVIKKAENSLPGFGNVMQNNPELKKQYINASTNMLAKNLTQSGKNQETNDTQKNGFDLSNLLSGLGGFGGLSGLGGLFENKPDQKQDNAAHLLNQNNHKLKEPAGIDDLLKDFTNLSEASIKLDNDLKSHVTSDQIKNVHIGSSKRNVKN